MKKETKDESFGRAILFTVRGFGMVWIYPAISASIGFAAHKTQYPKNENKSKRRKAMICKIPGCRGAIDEIRSCIFPGAKTRANPCKKCGTMHGENNEPLIAKIDVDGVPLEAYIYWGQNGINFSMFTKSELAELQQAEEETGLIAGVCDIGLDDDDDPEFEANGPPSQKDWPI